MNPANPTEFNGFAREMALLARPDLLQKTGRGSVSALDPGPDHIAYEERPAVPHLDARNGCTQPDSAIPFREALRRALYSLAMRQTDPVARDNFLSILRKDGWL